jgi:hypothetical protein
VWIYFSIENHDGLGPPLVDRWMRRSVVDYGHRRMKSSPELGLAAAPGRGGLPVTAQQREGSTGSPSQASPLCGGWRGDRAAVVKKRWWWCSVGVVLESRERRRRAGRGAVEDGRALTFYRGRGGGRWLWQRNGRP